MSWWLIAVIIWQVLLTILLIVTIMAIGHQHQQLQIQKQVTFKLANMIDEAFSQHGMNMERVASVVQEIADIINSQSPQVPNRDLKN